MAGEAQEGPPISAGDQQMSAERTPDQGQSAITQQEAASGRGLNKLTSILKSIAQIIRGKHEQSGIVDHNKINPFSTKEPQPPNKFQPGEPSQP